MPIYHIILTEYIHLLSLHYDSIVSTSISLSILYTHALFLMTSNVTEFHQCCNSCCFVRRGITAVIVESQPVSDSRHTATHSDSAVVSGSELVSHQVVHH